MSNEADKKHPWAKFKAAPSVPAVPRAPSASTTLRKMVVKPMGRPGALAPASPPPLTAKPTAAPIAFPKPRAIAPVALPDRAAAAPAPAKPTAAEPVLRNDWAAPRLGDTTEARLGEVPGDVAPPERDPQERTIPPFGISEELVKEFSRVAAEDAEVTALKKRRAERKGFWFWHALQDSLEENRRRRRSLGEWWGDWRRTSAFKVLVAFVALYTALAVVRRPSATAIEHSRHAEELGALQNFLKSYAAAGGTVLAAKPFGGAELYPRGVVLQGEMLDAFRRADVGETFSVQVKDPMWNPVSGFYAYPPIFAGGNYFHLERKFNLKLYRCTFLVRKDTATSGTIMLAKVELVF